MGAGTAPRALILVVLCCVAALVWPDTLELVAAAKANDLAKVKSLLLARVDPNQSGDDGRSALSYAVDHDNLDMVRTLLDAGADVDSPYEAEPGPGRYVTTVLVRAASRGRSGMVDLLLSRGAQRSHLDAYYLASLEYAIDRGDPQTARELLVSGNATVPESFDWVMRYEMGTPELQGLIRQANPNLAKHTVLGDLVSMADGDGASVWSLPGDLAFPLSTSTLRDDRQPARYSTDKAFDGSLSTSWVEGRSDDGVGEMIAFPVPRNATTLSIVPGYGEEQYYAKNNRVKTARLMVCRLHRSPGQAYSFLTVTKLVESRLSFADARRYQDFPVKVPAMEGFSEYVDTVFAVLQIQEVYPGSQWRDTCIAEIRVR